MIHQSTLRVYIFFKLYTRINNVKKSLEESELITTGKGFDVLLLVIFNLSESTVV